MKTRYILTTAVMILVVMMFAVNGCGGGGSSSGGEDEPDTIVETPTSYSEKEITSEGGSISIIDEYNNKIEVTFPKDVLRETTQISLGILSEQPDLPIETQHISAFEIKPYNADLYGSVFIKVTYENAIQDMNRTLLFRKKTDSLLIPLADHEYFTYGGIADNKTFRAYAFMLGVFAEGKMSSDQIINQIDLLSASREIDLNQKNAKMNIDPPIYTCDTKLAKEMWNIWKEESYGLAEYYKWANILGIPDPDNKNWDYDCTIYTGMGALEVLKCIPEDICDKRYKHLISDVLYTITKVSCINESEIYARLYNRFTDIATKCIEGGTLVLSFSGVREIKEKFKVGRVDMFAEGTVMLFAKAENFDESPPSTYGPFVIREDWMNNPPFVLDGSGTTVRSSPWDDSPYECHFDMFGHVKVEVDGIRESTLVHTIDVRASFYEGSYVECGDSYAHTYLPHMPLNKRFKVILSPENNFMDMDTDSPSSWEDITETWSMKAELLLPQDLLP